MLQKKSPKTPKTTLVKKRKVHSSGKQKTAVAKSTAKRSKESFFIACIGASAGGLKAITEFLENFPNDSGVALIFIQHLAETPKSLLSQILTQRTSMPVIEGEDGVVILPNNLYVIPSGNNMTLDKNGKLELVKRKEQLLRLPIDGLFRALAESKGHKSIGVVLSGAASDGALGLKFIQQAGGVTFAQSEGSAEYPSMPHHAATIGAADYILNPQEIAAKIVDRFILD